MYDVASLPDVLLACGAQLSSQLQQQWPHLVALELASRAEQRNRKRGVPQDVENHVEASEADSSAAEISNPAPTEPDPGAQQVQEIQIHWPPPEPALEAPAAAAPPAVAQKPVEFCSQQGVLALCQTSAEDRQAYLRSLPQQQLLQVATLQSQALARERQKAAAWKKTIALKNQAIRRLKVQHQKKQQKLLQLHDCSDPLDIVRHKGRKLTWKGSVVLGLRKTIAFVSASSYPLASLVATSRWTVTRCEVLCWSHMLSKSQAFHNGMFLLLRCVRQWLGDRMQEEVPAQQEAPLQLVMAKTQNTSSISREVANQDQACHDDLGLPRAVVMQEQVPDWLRLRCPETAGVSGTLSLGLSYWSGDATNSSIWNKQKLQGLEFASSLMVNWPALQQNKP